MRNISTLLEMVTQKRVLQALDFGCGLGISLKLLSTAGIQTIGFDPSQMRSTYARDAGYVMANDEGDLKRYAPYDIVLCDNVLEHVPEPRSTLSSLASFCREGSLLYVSVPSYEEEFISRQLDAIKRGLPVDMTINPWEHLNYFDLRRLDKLMRGHGFNPIETCELAGHVDIGLRPELFMVKRLKNSVASMLRLISYAVFGRTKRNVTNAFYRFSGVHH
jgi:SAM-dependent methyltransferase